MNRYQQDYATSKAALLTLKEQAKAIEQNYISTHGIVNSDGTVPEYVYMIDNDEDFDRANEATANEIEQTGLFEAEKALKAAEDNLIQYALSIVPAGVRDTLSDRCFGQNGKTMLLKIRNEVLELAFRLDTKTAPKIA